MNQFGVGQVRINRLIDPQPLGLICSGPHQPKLFLLKDEFIFRMYSIALIAITAAAIAKGDMMDGLIFMVQPGTYAEQQSNVPLDERSWSSVSKISVMIVSHSFLKSHVSSIGAHR